MNDKNAVLLLSEERYPDGANVPTIHKEYRCSCGCGKIIEESVPGFGELYVWIECSSCKERYTILKGYGHIWEVKEK